MAKLVYRNNEYIVLQGRRGCTIINTKSDTHHGHIKTIKTCEMLLKLMDRQVVPDSTYLRNTILRICLDDKYKDKVINRIEKDKQRQYYYNPQKGIRV